MTSQRVNTCNQRPLSLDTTSLCGQQQSVHIPFLTCSASCNANDEYSIVPLKNTRGSQAFFEFWTANHDNHRLFNIRLIGSASSLDQSSSIAAADLALYSKWGLSILQRHEDNETIKILLPVLTEPAQVCQAVEGLQRGVITLTWLTVEPILVLANAIGVSAPLRTCHSHRRHFKPRLACCYVQLDSLEDACQAYLRSELTVGCPTGCILSVAKLADHLGLPDLCATACELIVHHSWHRETHLGTFTDTMKQVQQLTDYKNSAQMWRELLHHPCRGATSELQVFQLLEALKTCEQDIRDALRWSDMPTSDAQALLYILSRQENTWHCPQHGLHNTSGSADEESSQKQHCWDQAGNLMRTAVLQCLLPMGTTVINSCQRSRFLHDIHLPLPDKGVKLMLPITATESLVLKMSSKMHEGELLCSCSDNACDT